jgi:hypothetical protein
LRIINNDATPERLSHAREAGLSTELLEFVSPEGHLDRRRQIFDILDTYYSQGIISGAQRDGGKSYLKLVSESEAKTRVVMSYQGGIDNAHSRFDLLDFIELKTPSWRSAKAARLATPPYLRLALDWLEATLEEELSISTLGNLYIDGRHTSAERGIFILKQTLDWLAYHFRFKNVPATPQNNKWLEFLDRQENKNSR